MAAPLKNQYWKERSKDGRNAAFPNPEALKKAAIAYFEAADETPWYRNEVVKGGDNAGTVYQVETTRPYNMWAMALHMGVNSTWFNKFPLTQTYNADKDAWDEVLCFIADTMKSQKYEGAAVGAFNPNIIMRDLGLKELTQHSNDPENPLPTAPQVLVYLPGKGSMEPPPPNAIIDLPKKDYHDYQDV